MNGGQGCRSGSRGGGGHTTVTMDYLTLAVARRGAVSRVKLS